jgi:hypothetical protein
MRNPAGPVPGQNWTGDDDEDFEQSCALPASLPESLILASLL